MLWLKTLLALVPDLLRRWDEYRAQRLKAKRDEDIEDIKSDPIDYANKHFGVSKQPEDGKVRPDKAEDSDSQS